VETCFCRPAVLIAALVFGYNGVLAMAASFQRIFAIARFTDQNPVNLLGFVAANKS
jgi:hypothetical protein